MIASGSSPTTASNTAIATLPPLDVVMSNQASMTSIGGRDGGDRPGGWVAAKRAATASAPRTAHIAQSKPSQAMS